MPEPSAHAAAAAGPAASQPSRAGAGEHAPTHEAESTRQRLFTADIMPTWWQRPPSADAAPLHQPALMELTSALRSGAPLILLRAPRAGFGKTHLLARWAAQPEIDPHYLLASLPWDAAAPSSASSSGPHRALSLQHSIIGLLGRFPSSQHLQKTCCGVLATLLSRLIQQGKVPCANRTQALATLARDPLSLIAQSGSASALAQWFAAQFHALLRPMAQAITADSSPDPDPDPSPLLENWLHRLWQAVLLSLHQPDTATRSAADPDPDPNPNPAAVALLQQGVQSDASARQLLHLLTQWRPLVLIADHLDGLISQPQTCTDLATLALALGQLPRVHILLSVNDDWWQHILTKNLPSALRDRLDASSISLPPLTLHDALNLLRSRLRSQSQAATDTATKRFLQSLPLEPFFTEHDQNQSRNQNQDHEASQARGVSCRDLLRWVNPQWKAWLQAHPLPQTQAPSPSPSSESPPPLPALTADPPAAEHEDEKALAKLAQHLQQEAKGRTVDLSHYQDESDPPPPGVVPLPKPAWQGPFLVEDEHKPNPAAAASSSAAATPSPPRSNTTPNPSADLLHSRFIQWKAHLMHKGEVPELEESGFRDLLRLTGQHFPMIRHEETELPGLSGQSIPRWQLPGQEIIFGLPPFQQRDQWRLLGSYVAGRIAEIATAAAQYSEPMPDLKWVIFIQQQTATSWQALKGDDVLPASLDAVLDTLLLSPAEQVDLVALHSLLRELSHKNKAQTALTSTGAGSASASISDASAPFAFAAQSGLGLPGSASAHHRPASPANITAALHDLVASKLAPLWRRITRPSAIAPR